MIQYSLEVGICWAILYLVYIIFLRRETFFSINRLYLLGSLLIGLIIPMLRMIPIAVQQEVQVVNEALYFISAGPELIASNITNPTPEDVALISLSSMLLIIYCIGHLFFGLRFISGLSRIFKLYANGEITHKETFTLVETKDFHLPFSFLNCVFFSTKLPLKDDIEKILKHELTHIRSWHTLDILFIEFLQVVFWFNPLIYLYKKSIKESHEYVADATVLEDTSQKIYGQILLRQSQSGLQISLANHFFQSHIKKRIKMMTQKKSKRPALLKYLVALPMILLLAILFQSQTLPKSELEREQLLIIDKDTRKGEYLVSYKFKNDSEVTNEEPGDAQTSKTTPGIMLFEGAKTDMTHLESRKYKGVEFLSDKRAVEILGEKARGRNVVNVLDTEDFVLNTESVKSKFYQQNGEWRFSFESGDRGKINVVIKDKNFKKVKTIDFNKPTRILDFAISDLNSSVKVFQLIVGGDSGNTISTAIIDFETGLPNYEYFDSQEDIDYDRLKKPSLIPIRKEHLKKNIENVFGFGERNHPIHKVNIQHKGIDLIADMDTPVYATGDGVVVNATYTEGYGNYITIEHYGNYRTLYAHMSSYNVEVGAKVTKGQEIGKVGSTGQSTAPHLHYEVQNNGAAIDPMPFLKEYIQLEDKGYQSIDPRFPGCEDLVGSEKDKNDCSNSKFKEYVETNLVYPEEAKNNGVQGLAVAKLLIDESGNIVNIEHIRTLGSGTKEASADLLAKMKSEIKWIPAKENGVAVKKHVVVPVRFELGDGHAYMDSHSTHTIEDPDYPGLYVFDNYGPTVYYSFYTEGKDEVTFNLLDDTERVIQTYKVKPTTKEFTGHFKQDRSNGQQYFIEAKQGDFVQKKKVLVYNTNKK